MAVRTDATHTNVPSSLGSTRAISDNQLTTGEGQTMTTGGGKEMVVEVADVVEVVRVDSTTARLARRRPSPR